ncbi:carbonic anhydrase [Xylariaceae sp. FL1651]|nr:carbonic anhydrase [Xylariaceae sp. FL1651]
MATTWIDLLERNRLYAQNKHRPEPYISEFGTSDIGIPPVFIFSCIDFRAAPEQLLEMHGEEAFIVRNLGGRVKASIADLAFVEHVSQGQAIKDIIIMHHTDCGLTHFEQGAIHEALKAKHPEAAHEIDQLKMPTYEGGSIDKHKETLRKDIEFFKNLPFIRQELRDSVKGYVYDIKSGKLIPESS